MPEPCGTSRLIATAALGCGLVLLGCSTPPPAREAGVRAQTPVAESGGPQPGQLSHWLRFPAADEPRPKFECARPTLDGVSVRAGETVEWSWEVANTGLGELRLWLVPQLTWGTVLHGPRWRIVPPGGRATISASFSARPDFCGAPAFWWSVRTNDPTAQAPALRVSLDVRPQGSVEEFEATYGPAGDVEHWLKPPPADSPQPRFACAETTADLGDVWPGAGFKPAWTIENTGAAPLRVFVRLGCCTWVNRDALIVPPGERVTIRARVCNMRAGEFVQHPRMSTNDRTQPEVPAKLKGVFRRALRIACEGKECSGVAFEDVAHGARPQTKTLLLVRCDGGPLRPQVRAITRRDPDGDGSANLTANLRELEAGERYELEVTASPPWLVGPGGALYDVQLETGGEEQPSDSISVLVR